MKIPVSVIDLKVAADDHRLVGVHYLQGDCRNAAVLEKMAIRTARGVIIVTSDDLINVSTAMLVRKLNPDCRIVVRMFNQGLIPRLGHAIRNTTALSVSALTAPLLAITAVTGDALGAFKFDDHSMQIAEITVDSQNQMANLRITVLASRHRLFVLAVLPQAGATQRLHEVAGDKTLALGDRVVVCGSPHDLEPLLQAGRVGLLPTVLWAGWPRLAMRTLRRTLGEIDLSVKLGTAALFLTLFISTLVLRFGGINSSWADSFYQTVSVVATGADLQGDKQSPGMKVFLAGLKIVGAALLAGFTAIFTQYLLRAKLGGALEARRIPDGGHVVVCGLGNVGFRCVEELLRLNQPVVAVDMVQDNPFVSTVRRMGVPVVIGDATVTEVLRQVRAESARAVIATTPSELANLEIALLVRETHPTQRVVVRLTDPEFAATVRDSGNIRLALSVPAMAAPAFAAALFGDRVQTLLTIGESMLAVVELTVQPNDPCLHQVSLLAAMIDYQFLPIGVAGREPYTASGIPQNYRLVDGDRVTVIIGLSDLERLLRRERAELRWHVIVDSIPNFAKEALLPILRTAMSCSQSEAEDFMVKTPFVLGSKLTRGMAEELCRMVMRQRAKAHISESADLLTAS